MDNKINLELLNSLIEQHKMFNEELQFSQQKRKQFIKTHPEILASDTTWDLENTASKNELDLKLVSYSRQKLYENKDTLIKNHPGKIAAFVGSELFIAETSYELDQKIKKSNYSFLPYYSEDLT